MSTEIILAIGATAEFNTCGSCKFFARTMDAGAYAMTSGVCTFVMPQKLRAMYAPKTYVEGDENRSRLQDTERCDLYRNDGKVYIVQRRVPDDRGG